MLRKARLRSAAARGAVGKPVDRVSSDTRSQAERPDTSFTANGKKYFNGKLEKPAISAS